MNTAVTYQRADSSTGRKLCTVKNSTLYLLHPADKILFNGPTVHRADKMIFLKQFSCNSLTGRHFICCNGPTVQQADNVIFFSSFHIICNGQTLHTSFNCCNGPTVQRADNVIFFQFSYNFVTGRHLILASIVATGRQFNGPTMSFFSSFHIILQRADTSY